MEVAEFIPIPRNLCLTPERRESFSAGKVYFLLKNEESHRFSSKCPNEDGQKDGGWTRKITGIMRMLEI